jgi:hypothetical protein
MATMSHQSHQSLYAQRLEQKMVAAVQTIKMLLFMLVFFLTFTLIKRNDDKSGIAAQAVTYGTNDISGNAATKINNISANVRINVCSNAADV